MKGWLPMTLGLLGVVLGALWTLQGLNVLGDSKMSGVTLWAIIGPIVALAGLIAIVTGERIRSRSKKAANNKAANNKAANNEAPHP
jgi:lipopolysaccharide export LptBFGC system permease protein LptF